MAHPPTGDREPDTVDPSLDELLNGSIPQGTPSSPELLEELHQLTERTRDEASPRRRARRFRVSRGAAFGLAALVFLGGGAAAVGVLDVRSYWADHDVRPHAHYTFELPSGAECEVERRFTGLTSSGKMRVEGFDMTDEQDEFAHEIYSDAQSRVDELITTDEFAEEVIHQEEFPGREEASEDVAYFFAVINSLDNQIHNEYRDAMDDMGLGGAALGHSCPGADFEGSWLNEYGDMDTYEAEREESGE